ncbi:MAG: nitroreductase family deazaflavin-dependent oxidoreductase [Dehalococcoidia bacterium]
MNRGFKRVGNRLGVSLYRLLNGRFLFGGSGTIVITAPGRRSGVPRSTPVQSIETPDGLLVWGTGGGAKTDPDWFRNLRAATTVEVQRGPTRYRARPRELLGPERDEVWTAVILAQRPAVARYARRAGRTIPVALLDPLE